MPEKWWIIVLLRSTSISSRGSTPRFLLILLLLYSLGSDVLWRSTTDVKLRWRASSCLLRLFLTERFFPRPRIERGFPCFHRYAWQYKIFWCLHWYQKTIISLRSENTFLWNKRCTEDNSEEIYFWKQYNYIHDNNRISLLVIEMNY